VAKNKKDAVSGTANRLMVNTVVDQVGNVCFGGREA
jgi:hypothetical protein